MSASRQMLSLGKVATMFGLVILASGPAMASDTEALLVCDGEFITLGDRPANGATIPGFSANIRANKLVISGSGFFDGSYVARFAQSDQMNFDFIDARGRQDRGIFVNLNRISGHIVLMKVAWSPDSPSKLERINAWIDGQCSRANRVF